MVQTFVQNIEISKQYKFEAAHRVLSQKMAPRLCHNLHGHSYNLIVELQAHELNDEDMVIDYGYVDLTVKPIINELDHSYMYGTLDDLEMIDLLQEKHCKLNKIPGKSPTAENISKYIALQILKNLSMLPKQFAKNIKRVRVTIKETEKTTARTTLFVS